MRIEGFELFEVKVDRVRLRSIEWTDDRLSGVASITHVDTE
jgi:hypothetical protein